MLLLGQAFECCLLKGPTDPDLAQQRVLTHFLPWQSTPGFNEQCSQTLLNLLTEESAQRRLSLHSQRCSKANLLYLPVHEHLLEAPNSIIALPLWRDKSVLAAHTAGCSVHGNLFSFCFSLLQAFFYGLLSVHMEVQRPMCCLCIITKQQKAKRGLRHPEQLFHGQMIKRKGCC